MSMVNVGHSGHLSIFTLFEALNDAFEVQFFFRASFLHLTKDTDTIWDHAAQIFLKWKIVKQCL